MRGFVPIVVLAALVCANVPDAYADARPRVAVLGLEVTSAVDVRTTELAKELTEGMRARARLGAGPYAYAPSSERELIDEKLIKACDNEAPGCMSEIGKELDADVIVYGKLEKVDKAARVTVHLLDVGKKSKLNRIGVTIPISATKEEVRTAARRAYEELAGASEAGGVGTVEVETNVLSGTVYVDDSSSEVLANGRATLTLPEGRYRIAVESTGRQRKEITVTVKAEQVITQQFDLLEGGVGLRPKKAFNIWKPAFGVSVAAFIGVGTYWGYLLGSWKGDVDSIQAAKREAGQITENDCDGPSVREGVEVRNSVLADVCKTRDTYFTMSYVWALTVPLVAVTGYFAFFHDRGKKTERSVALTPMVTPDSAGAIVHGRF
ncbi:MAG: hypothetical protein ACKV2T_07675 [Kofleriaceae bacterium]